MEAWRGKPDSWRMRVARGSHAGPVPQLRDAVLERGAETQAGPLALG